MAKFKVVNNAIFYKNARYEIGDEIELDKVEARSFEGIVEPTKGQASKAEEVETEVEAEVEATEAPVETPKPEKKQSAPKGKGKGKGKGKK